MINTNVCFINVDITYLHTYLERHFYNKPLILTDHLPPDQSPLKNNTNLEIYKN